MNIMITIILACFFSINIASAAEDTKTFNFTGKVIYSHASLALPYESPVTGSFSYDANVVSYIMPLNPSGEYGSWGYLAPNALTINFGGHTLVSGNLGYSIYANFTSASNDAFYIGAYDLLLDGVSAGNGYFAGSLFSNYISPNAIINALPPQNINFSYFSAESSYGQFFFDSQEPAVVFNFANIALATPVDEPLTFIMLIAGLGLITFEMKRRRV